MIDKRFIENSMIYGEMSMEQINKWFSFTQKKFINNIDTFYYSVKFKNDFRVKTKDNAVLKMRKYFKFKYNGLGDFGENGEVYLKELNKKLLLKPCTFAKLYNNCLSYPEYFDIFIADSVPSFMDGGESVTCECIVQIRSYMLWMFGVHDAFKNSYEYVKALANYFGFTIDFVQENRADYCWHTNYLKNPEKFLNLDDFYKMRVDRYKDNFAHYQKVGTEGYEIDYLSMGKRSDKVFIRIYLKTKEVIEQNYKPWFFQIWKMNGLINDYDLYVYEKCFQKKSWFYRWYARLEFYSEYGLNDTYVQLCKDLVKGTKGMGEDDMIDLAKKLTPEINLIVNVEYQTMRKHSRSYDLVPFKDNGNKGECKRIYDYLSNRKIIMDYLTDCVFKLVEPKGDKKKYRRPLCAFWNALRNTKCLDVKYTPDEIQLVRKYNRKLNIQSMRKKVFNSCVTLGIYTRGKNTDNPLQDAFEALLRMNDNDVYDAQRFKQKKLQQLNDEELAGVYEDGAIHDFEVIRVGTGEVYNNHTLNKWDCKDGGFNDSQGSV